MDAHLLDGRGAIVNQVVRVNGEKAPAHQLREHVFAAQRRDGLAPIHEAAANGEAFVMVVLGHGVDERRWIRLGPRIHRAARQRTHGVDGGERAFPQPPAIVATGHAQIDFLDAVLTDVRNEHLAIHVPRELLRMPQAICPNLRRGVVHVDEWVVRGDAVGAALRTRQWVDAHDGAEWRCQPLPVVHRVLRRTAIAEAGIEQAVIRRAGRRGGIERQGADIVVRRELAHAQHLTGGAGENRGGRVPRRPFADDALLHVGGRFNVVRHATLHARAVRRVELAVTRVTGLAELGMEGQP